MGKVSIKDIARAAGVSHSTVSRALRDSPLLRPETRERIQRLAREMGYSPDTIARSLVTGRTHTVGVVMTTITDPFVAEIVRGVENCALPNGYSVILASSGGEPERELAAVDMLRAKRVDAVIVTSSRVGSLYLDRLELQGVPVVLINDHTSQGGPYTFSVTVDNRDGGRVATEHLVCRGHRRIAYIAAALGHSDSVERQAGYQQALRQAGLEVDPALVLRGDGRAEGGEQALARLQALPEPPTAAFCYNDMTAIGLLRAARRAGVRVPEDLAVVGFDDILYASYVCPPLTTISQPKAEMGERAMRMALALRDEDSPAPETEGQVVLPGRLVVRESSG
ncbi:MAG: LacI family transcriptional regulator [Chloroflexi bacterium]|nr:LacI family transcriptional regulator [Chloroflexota bacterium]